MKKKKRVMWDYMIWPLSVLIDKQEKELRELGSAGWELVAVNDNYMYFKRPLLVEQKEGVG